MMKHERQAILIDKNLHSVFKKYCKDNCLVIKNVVEKLIKEQLVTNGYSIHTQKKD